MDGGGFDQIERRDLDSFKHMRPHGTADYNFNETVSEKLVK